jgi:hypothetical protein
MRLIGAEGAADGRRFPFVDRRMSVVAHVTLAPQCCPLRWSVFVLQTIYVSHDHLLPFIVFLQKYNPIEVVLMFGGKNLCVIDDVELIHLTVWDRNCLLAVF